MRPDLGTASAWLVINCMGLFWHTVPVLAPSGAVYHQFISLGPDGGAWSLSGTRDRLPPGWFSARERRAIRKVAELETLDPVAEPGVR